MDYIYYIWLPNTSRIDLSKGGNYIGQGSSALDEGETYGRMLEHLRIAYGEKKGKIYGSENLIKEVGASGVMFGVYDAPNFGINPKIFQLMENEGWVIESPAQRLDAAEILHIISHDGDLSSGNVATGGQANLYWKLKDASWVLSFKDEFDIKQKDYNTDNLNEVKILFSDSREVALRKLLNPEKYLVIRAASFAINKRILLNSDFLKELVIDYTIKKDTTSTKTKIKEEISSIINTINDKIFKRTIISSNDAENLVQDVLKRFTEWADLRIKIKAIDAALDQVEKNLGKITNFIVHGVDYETRKKSTTITQYQYELRLKRKDLVKYINNYQPAWYKMLMENIPSIPEKHTSERKENTGSELNKIVSDCIYRIFKHYLNIATSGNSNVKPSVTLRERMESLYKEHGIKMWRFYDFYEIAITKWRKEKNRNLLKGDFNPEEERYLVTFQPEFTEDSYNYLWSEEYINEIEDIDGDIIPTYLW